MGSVIFMGRSIRLEVVVACFLILIFYIIVQKVKVSRLKNQLSEEEVKKYYLEKTVSLLSGKVRESQEYRDVSEQTQQKILRNPSQYYYVKDTIFGSDKELEFFGYLNGYLGKPTDPKKRYVVLPQVSLHAYIQPKSLLGFKEKSAALRLIGGKNTDFLICKTDPDGGFRPAVAVEINGETHDTNKKTIENDEIKSILFKSLGIPLVSHTLGSGRFIQSEVAPYLN